MSATVKIYGIPQSRTLRCLWMARELGVSHENVQVHFAKTRESPELMQVNPNARIPAIEDGNFQLYESMAINLYLAKKYGAGNDITPTSLEDEARAIQWSFWVMTEIEKPLLTFMLNTLGIRPSDETTLAQCRKDLDRPLAVLEAEIAIKDWIIGNKFTVADLNVASVMVWAKTGKLDLTAYPRVSDWLRRCMERPAFRAKSP
ncbi:MAG: glutathione S-transferase family protein [Acetobacteraceae bacterium]|nr:glutathione S-transferase family protein [Acetobacteraceae bacterium]